MEYIKTTVIGDKSLMIKLHQPNKLNAMNIQMMDELCEAIADAEKNGNYQCVVLTGEGRGFCSGHDMGGDDSVLPPTDEMSESVRLKRRIDRATKPVQMMVASNMVFIVAVNGVAYGGGLGLLMGGDILIASESAKFNATGVAHGITGCEFGNSWMLPRMVGRNWANKILYTACVVDAQTALQIGLVTDLYEDKALLPAAIKMANEVASFSAYGMALTKRTMNDNLGSSDFGQALEYENRALVLTEMTSNLDEAHSAYSQKIAPSFKE